jgi:hypothetical protein
MSSPGGISVSYDLFVWDPVRDAPMPSSAHEALETMERLSTAGDSPNPVFGKFSGALVKCYEAALQGKPPDLQAFWGSDPRQTAASCKTAVYRLCLPPEAGMEQLACVVQEAAVFGLVVLDDENGMCFLPDGTIYPQDMREVWESDLAELRAGPEDPELKKPDNRTLLQTIASELFDALGRGNKRIY